MVDSAQPDTDDTDFHLGLPLPTPQVNYYRLCSQDTVCMYDNRCTYFYWFTIFHERYEQGK